VDAWEILLLAWKEDDDLPCYHLREKYSTDVLEGIGVDTLLLVCSFGGLTHAQVCRSLEYFAKAVIYPRQRVTVVASR
jgi:hypothetical protein